MKKPARDVGAGIVICIEKTPRKRGSYSMGVGNGALRVVS